MPSEVYEFEDFRLDVSEKSLRRGEQSVPLTPKVFETLRILVENAGRLVERDELMRNIWPDRFVEEGNLTFNVKVLRKSLGDSSAEPKFIETVPRLGYRFIAPVRQRDGDHATEIQHVELPARPNLWRTAAPLAVVAATLAVVGIWYVFGHFKFADSSIFSTPLVAEKLTTNGKTLHAVISPDGKNIVYTQGNGSDKQSIWLRVLATGNSVEIVPATDDFYYGLAMSPDGNTLYFVRHPRGQEGRFDVFRVSVFGGIPTKILSGTEGWVSLSADGNRISFVRCALKRDDFCSLYIADSSDGGNERRVFSTSYPIRIGDNKISADGNSVVFGVGQSETQGTDFGLMQVEIETGKVREISSEKFFNILSLAWIPDRNGLIISASKTPTKRYRLWFMPSGGGEPIPLTQDSESYTSLSVDKSAAAMVSVQTRQSYQLHLFTTDSPQKNRILADATSVAFTSDDRILFSSMMSGNDEIWSINVDGSGQRQLTNNQADENVPIASPDNNSVFFASNRTGKVQVWRMNADGSDQSQVTFGQGGAPLMVSPDSRWIYYHHALDKTLWRVSVNGGEEQLILDRREHHLALSNDCTTVAIAELQGTDHVLTIVRLSDGKVLQTIKPAEPRAELLNLKWSADGRELWYVSATGEYENNKLWKHELATGVTQRIAELGDDRITAFGFALSPNGKNFAIAKGRWSHDAVLLKSSK